MALLQNGTILAQYPCSRRGGVFSDARQMYGRTDRLNGLAGEGFTDSKGAVPNGHLPPSAWTMPRKPGGLSAYVGNNITLTNATAAAAAGVNIDGALTFTFTNADAALELVVSASGTVAITFTNAATLAGAIDGSGSATITLSVGTATLGAIVDAIGTAGVTFSASGTPSAIGHLAGDITPFTELSPQSLAAAVWAALSADNNISGTMGRLLNSVGGGSDPDTIAAAVWAAVARTLTAEVDANVTKVNDVTVAGSGTSGDPWGPA